VLTCQRIIQQSQDLLMFADVDKPWLTQILHLGDYQGNEGKVEPSGRRIKME